MKRTASFVLAVMVVMSIALTAWAHYVYPSDAGNHSGSAEKYHGYVTDWTDGWTAHQHKSICERKSALGVVWYQETLVFYHTTPYGRTQTGTQNWGACTSPYTGGGSGW